MIEQRHSVEIATIAWFENEHVNPDKVAMHLRLAVIRSGKHMVAVLFAACDTGLHREIENAINKTKPNRQPNQDTWKKETIMSTGGNGSALQASQ